MTSKKFLYVAQLTDKEQESIKAEVSEVLNNIPWCNKEEELENAMSSKLIDLEETIDINKYL